MCATSACNKSTDQLEELQSAIQKAIIPRDSSVGRTPRRLAAEPPVWKPSSFNKSTDQLEELQSAIQKVILPRDSSVSRTLFSGSDMRSSYLHGDNGQLGGKICTNKLEIMCVEDNLVQQKVIAKLVTKYGFSITEISSGEEALECLAARYAENPNYENFPAIILMDIILPGMSGCEATEAIRREHPTVPLPVIMVTGCDETEETLMNSIACGANDMVGKPHVAACLMARISAQLTVLHFWKSKLSAQNHERLLQEILPRSVIERIGPAGSSRLIYDEHKEVSIVFTDIVGFTDLASSSDTRAVIMLLDALFNAFDTLTKKHGVYKVETIGDAYMLVAGHEEESQDDHAVRAVNMAMDMIEVANGLKMPNGQPLRIRAGIHSGPAYSGVVGHLRPRYCLFGDTVNVASRMESTSLADCIQLSSFAIDCYKRQESCLPQSGAPAATCTTKSSIVRPNREVQFVKWGIRDIKGKGEMKTALIDIAGCAGCEACASKSSDDAVAIMPSTAET